MGNYSGKEFQRLQNQIADFTRSHRNLLASFENLIPKQPAMLNTLARQQAMMKRMTARIPQPDTSMVKALSRLAAGPQLKAMMRESQTARRLIVGQSDFLGKQFKILANMRAQNNALYGAIFARNAVKSDFIRMTHANSALLAGMAGIRGDIVKSGVLARVADIHRQIAANPALTQSSQIAKAFQRHSVTHPALGALRGLVDHQRQLSRLMNADLFGGTDAIAKNLVNLGHEVRVVGDEIIVSDGVFSLTELEETIAKAVDAKVSEPFLVIQQKLDALQPEQKPFFLMALFFIILLAWELSKGVLINMLTPRAEDMLEHIWIKSAQEQRVCFLTLAQKQPTKFTDGACFLVWGDGVRVRLEPRIAPNVMIMLHKGTIVTILARKGAWCMIRFYDHRTRLVETGWVIGRYLKRLK